MYNANNYGYNPYYQQRYTPMPPQQIQPDPMTSNNTSQIQPITNRNILNGKQVDNIEVVKAMDIPLDGSVSYFPIADGSAIVTKQLKMDGTSKTIVYKPIDEEKKETIKFLTQNDLDKALDELDLPILDDLKDEIKELKKQIKEIKAGKKGKGD